VSNIGLNLESSEDSDKDSKEVTDWGLLFMLLKSRGFSHKEILNLSYPQFNAYMNNINNPLSYPMTIPYMGSGEEKKEKIDSKEEFISMIADMNKDFM
jgi:hypothetical protein